MVFEHIFFVWAAFGFPILILFWWHKDRRRIAQGFPINRPRDYTTTMILQWAMFATLFLFWGWPRIASTFGLLGPFQPGFWRGIGISALVVCVMVMAWRSVRKVTGPKLEYYRKTISPIMPIVPQTRRDLRYFWGLSFTAGVVEEFIWRGFFLWYLTQWTSLWVAVVISSLCFSLSHSYQGIQGVFKVFLLGTVFAGVYIHSNSLWPGIFLHIMVDVIQGAQLFDLVQAIKKSNNQNPVEPAT